MRGKRVSSAQYLSTAGITPEHAGKTRCGFYTQKLNKDHPRACGENLAQPPPASRGAGSPPRMRGKPVIYTAAQAPPRITPAHAGKTIVGSYAVTRFRDHPRACGENKEQVLQDFFSGGSPPRMRGKLEYRVEGETNLRITPAHAGKTAKAYEAWQELWDHPRRGKPCIRPQPETTRRITPAPAGKTL